MTTNVISKLRISLVAALAAFAIASTTPASAALYTYNLFDNPNGTETSKGYDYGLRLDHYEKIFSFDNDSNAKLTYDSVSGVATITGTMRESLGYNAAKTDRLFGDLWTIDYTLTDLTDLGDGAFKDTAGNGSGTITRGGSILTLGAKSDGATYFTFDDDGYRLPSGSTLFSGRGWVDPTSGLRGANDFLFQAELAAVPLPAAGWLLIASFGGLAFMRRRQNSN